MRNAEKSVEAPLNYPPQGKLPGVFAESTAQGTGDAVPCNNAKYRLSVLLRRFVFYW